MLRQVSSNVLFCKFNIHIEDGQNICIGDTISYLELNDKVIQEIAQNIFQKLQSTIQTPTPQLALVDELMQ